MLMLKKILMLKKSNHLYLEKMRFLICGLIEPLKLDNFLLFIFSFGPDAFFRKHGITTSAPEPTPVPSAYSSCESRSRVSHLLVITIITLTVINSLCSSHMKLLKVSR